MKVILLQNVPKLGQKGDVKNVNDGYALNFLIPQKKAKNATEGEIAKMKHSREMNVQNEKALQSEVKKILSEIEGKTIKIIEKANEKGHLFAQVHLVEIADAIHEQLDIKKVSEDWINLEKPIKETGEFKINLEAYGKKAILNLVIESK
jgi:large subunit ribosomal protein L9